MKSIRRDVQRYIVNAIISAAAIGLATTAAAMPPNPETLQQHLDQGKPLPYYLENRPELLDRGIDTPSKFFPTAKSNVTGSFKALAILIKFSDKPESVVPAEFDTLLFVNRQGTVRHYYNEVSGNQLDIVTVNLPSSVGWTMAPQTYDYYCNDQNGTGEYPQNSQKLCEDVTALVNPVVNFSDYDNDGDNYVDAVILIHTGPGAEFTHTSTDIWSHKWSVWPPKLLDGVYVFDYSIQPEYWSIPGDITCGVFCHELGHVFGLPDLYDTDYSSRGVGKWSLMSYGSWCGPTGLGDYPSWLDAWSRIYLGFESAVNVSSNINGAAIESVESGGNIYRLWSSGAMGNEYFLVENRQKTGYDTYLPGSGLLIWHVDATVLSTINPNDDEWYPGYTSSGHYGVALEQADGQFHQEKYINSGDTGDPFPGTSAKTTFSPMSTPNSLSYAGENTYVVVDNISSSSSVMTADLQVSFASDVEETNDDILPDKIRIGQNYPNPFNPVTTIRLQTAVSGQTTVVVYDILGRRIVELLDSYLPAGIIADLTWDGHDQEGNEVASGVYFYEVVTEQERNVGKMTLIR
ncbi:MAG: M6 family metalloprotease domain-containing protein [Candidatus Zixiibacteriota bacterium]